MRLTVFQSRGLSWTICFSSSIALAKSAFFSAASASCLSLIGLSFFAATLAPRPHEKSHAWVVPQKVRRWIGDGPRRRSAMRCSSLP